MEVRVNLAAQANEPKVQYRWLSETTNFDDTNNWETPTRVGNVFRFPFRQAGTLTGELCVQAGPWPDATTEKAGIDAAQE
jgi:hypothetical protein